MANLSQADSANEKATGRQAAEAGSQTANEAQIRSTVEALVRRLESLRDGPESVAKLVALGPDAIAPLSEALLQGHPASVYEPRRWLVDALAGLGARDALEQYLRQRPVLADAAARFGEEAVQNAAARALARWRDEAAFQLLLDVARSSPSAGVLAALGSFRRSEALPFLVAGLDNDICRADAEEALAAMGTAAVAALVAAALHVRLHGDGETPSSLIRRRSATRLLADLGVDTATWPALSPLLRDEDGEILTAMARLAIAHGTPPQRRALADKLRAARPGADPFLRLAINDALVGLWEADG